jgi:hypothetical protein
MESQAYQEKIYNLIDQRKTQLHQIQEALQQDDVFFMKCFKIQDCVSSLNKQKETIALQMRNLFLLGCFVSSVLEISNCLEKIELLERILEDFDLFVGSAVPLTSKFYINQYAKIALTPPRLQLSSRGTKFYKTPKSILNEFLNVSKIITLPEEMNYAVVVESVCNILDYIYNIFADKVLNPKDCYESILKIDMLLQNRFFSLMYENMLNLAQDSLNDEFIKLNDIVYNCDKVDEGAVLEKLLME